MHPRESSADDATKRTEQPSPAAPGPDPFRVAEAIAAQAYVASRMPDAYRYDVGNGVRRAFREPRPR